MTMPDWESLRAAASEAVARAYAPYSNYPVGAAGQADDGRVHVGCNVENASYGLSLCAECGLVSTLVASGGARLTAVTCCDAEGRTIMPCGRCRQLLYEHGGGDLLIDTPDGVRPMREVLPAAFGPADLERDHEL
ncbi:MAG: cytidine deaminase [Streptosporangiaceae bacterium]